MLIAVLGTLSGVFAVAGYAPYLLETVRGRVRPHLYTWLVWTALQIIAVAAILSGGGGLAAFAGLAVGVVLCVLTLGLALAYGSKTLTHSDKWFLAGAVAASALYVASTDPVWAVALICVIDFLGFVPTMRKAYRAPDSEHTALYACSALSNAFALMALEQVTFTTAAYAASLTITNVICVATIWAGKRNALRLPARGETVRAKRGS